jgi:hypothetical protein
MRGSARAQVKDALKVVANVLNAVEPYYCGSQTAYEFGPLSGAIALLQVLDEGVRGGSW